MSSSMFDAMVADNLAVVFDDSAMEGLNRNLHALNGLASLLSSTCDVPSAEELYALVNLIREEQQRLLRQGVQKPN